MGQRSGMTSAGGTPLPADGVCRTHKVPPAGMAVHPASHPGNRHDTAPHQGGTGQHLSTSTAGRTTGLDSEPENNFHPTCVIRGPRDPQPNGNSCTELCSIPRAHQPPDELDRNWNGVRHPCIRQSVCRRQENAAATEGKRSNHPAERHLHDSTTCRRPPNDMSQRDRSMADRHTQPTQWHGPCGG